MIEVLPNRLKDTLVKWLYTLPIWVRENIKVVSMDLWKPYREGINEVLPHAEIVADRYHVMKNLNDVIDKVRRAIQKHLPKDLASQLNGLRWVCSRTRIP